MTPVDPLLSSTPLLDFRHPSLAALIADRGGEPCRCMIELVQSTTSCETRSTLAITAPTTFLPLKYSTTGMDNATRRERC